LSSIYAALMVESCVLWWCDVWYTEVDVRTRTKSPSAAAEVVPKRNHDVNIGANVRNADAVTKKQLLKSRKHLLTSQNPRRKSVRRPPPRWMFQRAGNNPLRWLRWLSRRWVMKSGYAILFTWTKSWMNMSLSGSVAPYLDQLSIQLVVHLRSDACRYSLTKRCCR